MQQAEKKEIIAQSVWDLLVEQDFKAPSIREITRRSGFGIGTIYDYFGRVQELLLFVVLRQQEQVIEAAKQLIDTHPADEPADKLICAIVTLIFAEVGKLNANFFKFVDGVALRGGNSPRVFLRPMDQLINPLLAARMRDRTGTFLPLDAKEIRLLLQSMGAMIRFPILVGDSYFGSEEHRALVQSATLRLFVKAPVVGPLQARQCSHLSQSAKMSG
ncbi:MAG: TetR/AcrR family transcriptional regulator [Alphaproteobacteria bacterium]|nr:TetR/AcrR family transcriptional regulator [Alphaproteobacteria bacterium]